MVKFVAGRQKGDYKVLTLISWWFFDLHIIKYPPYGEILPHVDVVKGKRHHRLNFEIKGKGSFTCNRYKKWWRFTYFRPDLYYHSFINGMKTRYVLSLGWVTNI